ncbi:MAG: extracellular protein [Deltaproteobacteria bacterium]|nr:extracellular protein [Deltaproteobacteria bacterium]
MKKLLAGLVVLCFLFIAVSAQAGQFGDLIAKIGEARNSLLVMEKYKDKRGADQQKLVKDTADAVSAMLAKMKAPEGKEVKFKELVDTWNAFKKTRESQLAPSIIAGKRDEAYKVAHGMQQERLDTMYVLCDELDR